jgi:hypothetical protein
MKKSVLLPLLLLLSFTFTQPVYSQTAALISDHLTARLALLSEADVALAKSTLHIAYGHTSHGSQLITGMDGLRYFKPGYDTLYAFNPGGSGGALDLRDTPFSGASDLGNPDRTAWETATRNYLNANPQVNVVIWSWCGQVSSASAADITTYLTLMDGLEQDYPAVSFVYMTGHLDGGGLIGNLHLRNEQIRAYCRQHNKILFDFADIESYDPDGNYFLDKLATDNCDYDSDGNGSQDKNWAIDWQTLHTQGVDWYNCSPAHTQALNGNLKAYAAWYLWCAIAKRRNGTNLRLLHRDGACWSSWSVTTGWEVSTPPYYPGTSYARALELVGNGYKILHQDGAIYDSVGSWNVNTPPYYPSTAYAVDLEVTGSGETIILHQDGALWSSDTGWTLTAPPYYPGTAYAKALEKRDDASYVILHYDGAIYDSASGWLLTSPPYHPGTTWAVDLKLDVSGYVILHKDGALWSSTGGWIVTAPPYYPTTDYARTLALVGGGYKILHRDGAIYDSAAGWLTTTPPYYPGTNYAVDMEVQ